MTRTPVPPYTTFRLFINFVRVVDLSALGLTLGLLLILFERDTFPNRTRCRLGIPGLLPSLGKNRRALRLILEVGVVISQNCPGAQISLNDRGELKNGGKAEGVP